jgi:hypothetical protein
MPGNVLDKSRWRSQVTASFFSFLHFFLVFSVISCYSVFSSYENKKLFEKNTQKKQQTASGLLRWNIHELKEERYTLKGMPALEDVQKLQHRVSLEKRENPAGYQCHWVCARHNFPLYPFLTVGHGWSCGHKWTGLGCCQAVDQWTIEKVEDLVVNPSQNRCKSMTWVSMNDIDGGYAFWQDIWNSLNNSS